MQFRFRYSLSIVRNIEGHLHKIKGLSPMMGKERIGKISEMIDSILKNIIRW